MYYVSFAQVPGTYCSLLYENKRGTVVFQFEFKRNILMAVFYELNLY